MGESVWSHQNKEWQETLDLAKRYGWSSEKAKSHGGLSLTCPGSDQRHNIRVFSTGKGTENVARTYRKKISRCEHRDLRDPLGRAEASLEDAARLLRAAAALLDRDDAERQMQEILELVSEQLADVEAAFNEAAESFDNAASMVDELLSADDPDTGSSDVLMSASTQIRSAELTLRDLPSKDLTVMRLSAWMDELKVQRDELRRRLPRNIVSRRHE